MRHIFQCPSCRSYTLRDACGTCGSATENIIPLRYSTKDTYGRYRREAKEAERKARGLL